jgi:serine/threonine-protein kinase RsbW/stage II sporulation protein AB (anti-sigma F factor)
MQSVTQSLSVSYEAEPGSVAEARSAAAEFAAAAGANAIQIDAIRLAVSEAVTNAVLHAYRGGPGQIQVTAALAGSELWILVADEGGGMQPETDRPGLGLGLGLISQVCDSMSIVPRSAGGIEVRILFKLDVAPPGPEPEAAVAPAAAELGVGLPGPVSAVPAAPLPD